MRETIQNKQTSKRLDTLLCHRGQNWSGSTNHLTHEALRCGDGAAAAPAAPACLEAQWSEYVHLLVQVQPHHCGCLADEGVKPLNQHKVASIHTRQGDPGGRQRGGRRSRKHGQHLNGGQRVGLQRVTAGHVVISRRVCDAAC